MFGRKTLALAAKARELQATPDQAPPRSGYELAQVAAAFGVDIDPGVLYGAQTIDEVIQWIEGRRRVSRREAIAVPSVKRARDILAGGIGQLPLRLYGPNNQVEPWPLLDQPEEGKASVVTWTNVIDDLIFYPAAWLKVTHVGWHNRPVDAVKLDADTVTIQPRVVNHGIGSALTWPQVDGVIRIDSPNDPLLVAGARAIRALGRLEAAGLNAADGTPPVDYFTPVDAADPMEDDDVAVFLGRWKKARQAGSTAYVPAALKYNVNGWSPEQLQLNGAREMAIAEVARLTGVDPEDLGLSTTSRTYFNAQDRAKALLQRTYGPYMRAVESRLSMDDVTPHGWSVRFDTADLLRPDDKTAADTDKVLIDAKINDVDEVRARRGLAPLTAAQRQAATPAAPAPQETAAP